MKKFIAMILTLVMVFSFAAFSAFAYADSATAGRKVTTADGTEWPTKPVLYTDALACRGHT